MSSLRSDTVSACQIGLPSTLLNDEQGGGIAWSACESLEALLPYLQVHSPQAIVIGCQTRVQAQALLGWQGFSQATAVAAVMVVWPAPDRDLMRRMMQAGVQDVLAPEDAQGGRLQRAVLLAVARKQQDLEVRKAWSIDVGTGLPNRALLIELLNQLCALREREPAPMALLVLRLDGLETAESRLGEQAAHLLRRKAAVRLRACLRSSDFVAVVGSDAFAAVLPSMDRPQDAERVATKLATNLGEPFVVTGQQAVLSVGVGVALFPEHGRQAEELLRLASSAAAQTTGLRRAGMVGGSGAGAAANDD